MRGPPFVEEVGFLLKLVVLTEVEQGERVCKKVCLSENNLSHISTRNQQSF